ncbi:MAG: alpha/beta fold hydrolase, partial [Deltaproteobacteria bacterium]|nr:alpha/beta fold hydrolase [Deltaproteobacteria bacterium]
GGHAEAYSRNLIRLGQKYHAMAMDLVWHGFSSKPPYQGKAVPTYARQIVDLLDSMGIEKANVEGESLGGWTALWFALHYPNRLNKLILNTTAGVRFKPGVVDEHPAQGRQLLRERSLAAISNPNKETIRKRLEWLMASPDRVTDELVDIRYKIYTEPETQRALTAVFSNSFGDGDSDDYMVPEEDLKNIKAPTLVFWSEKNPGTGPEVGQRVHSMIPGSQFYCMPDAAHWPQWEHPEEHDRVILKFLSGEPLG